MEACVHIRAPLRDGEGKLCLSALQRLSLSLLDSNSGPSDFWTKPHRNKCREKEERGQELTAEHETQRRTTRGSESLSTAEMQNYVLCFSHRCIRLYKPDSKRGRDTEFNKPTLYSQ